MSDALFAVDVAKRRVRGLILPFGELSSASVSGTEPVMFSAGTVTLPADPSVVSLSDGHPGADALIPEVRGRAVELEETEAGIVAEFEIAKTPEGDALLARAADPNEPKPRLSAELRSLVRRGADAVSSILRGVAVVPRGAFQTAALFAALDEVTEAADELVDAQAALAAAQAAVAALLNSSAAPAAEAVADAEAEADKKEEDMNAANLAVVPVGLNAPAAPKKDETSADGLFAAIAASKMGAPEALKPFQGGDALFAISTLQHSGPSTVTIGADVQQPAYLGELWKRRKYQRRFVPLLAHSALTSYRAVGWQWDDGKEPQVGDYTGNTAEIPSNALDTKQISMDAQRIAGGHKLDRRYIDFNDQGVIASYFDKMTEDVSRKTDAKALAAILAASTTTTPGSVPAGIAKGLAAIVDGALAVLDTENDPGYALVDNALWREIVLTGKDDVLAFLTMSLGLEEGGLAGFSIRPATIGTAANAGKEVVVGAKEAITFFELGGEAPIRVEGIDPHHGAIDPAVFAYWATITSNAAAVRRVTTV
ncbi:phage major capsid protein [Microbacterium saperdae]